MQRRTFLAALSLPAAHVRGQAQAETPNPQETPTEPAKGSLLPLATTPPSVMAPTADGFQVIWGVSEHCLGRIEWKAPDDAKVPVPAGSASADDYGMTPQGAETLRVRVRGLPAGAKVLVRAVTTSAASGRQEASDWKPASTLAPDAADTHFAVWNDTHQSAPTIQALHKLTPSVDFLLWNGDICNDWKDPRSLLPTVLHPGGQDITHGRPLVFVWGNHDVRGPFAYQLPNFVATPQGKPYQAFRSGPVAIVCLHTGEDKPDSHPNFKGRVAFDALRAEQARWLDDVLQTPEMATAPFRLVFCHIPLRWKVETPPDYDKVGYDDFSLRSRNAWHAALVRWKAQAVISGHTHESFLLPATAEFPYAQLIGGGPRLTDATLLQGKATAEKLVLTLQKLDGKLAEELVLRAVV